VPLFCLTQKDSGYKFKPLPEAVLQAFWALQKQLTFGTSDGISYGWLTVCYHHHPCCHQNWWHSKRPRCHPNPGESRQKILRNFLCIQTAKRSWEKLFPIPTGGCSCSLGHGRLQCVLTRQAVHLIHRPQTFRETWPPEQQNDEQTTNCPLKSMTSSFSTKRDPTYQLTTCCGYLEQATTLPVSQPSIHFRPISMTDR